MGTAPVSSAHRLTAGRIQLQTPVQEDKALAQLPNLGPAQKGQGKLDNSFVRVLCQSLHISTKHAQRTSEITREGSQVASELRYDWCHFRNASVASSSEILWFRAFGHLAIRWNFLSWLKSHTNSRTINTWGKDKIHLGKFSSLGFQSLSLKFIKAASKLEQVGGSLLEKPEVQSRSTRHNVQLPLKYNRDYFSVNVILIHHIKLW